MLMDILCYIRFTVEAAFIRLKKGLKKRKKNNRYYFQKCVAVVAVTVWVLAALKSFNDDMGKKEEAQIVSVFGSHSFNKVSSEISCYGKYVDWSVSDNTKKLILEDIAARIGINRYELSDEKADGRQEKILRQNSVNGIVECRYITTKDSESYISMDINLYDTISATFEYQQILEDIMESLGIKGNVSVNLIGEINGNMDITARDKVSDYLLEAIDADIVCENRDEEVYTIYAYNKNIKEYINAVAGRVNVNLTMNYNEEDDVSYVNLAMPVNNKDY